MGSACPNGRGNTQISGGKGQLRGGRRPAAGEPNVARGNGTIARGNVKYARGNRIIGRGNRRVVRWKRRKPGGQRRVAAGNRAARCRSRWRAEVVEFAYLPLQQISLSKKRGNGQPNRFPANQTNQTKLCGHAGRVGALRRPDAAARRPYHFGGHRPPLQISRARFRSALCRPARSVGCAAASGRRRGSSSSSTGRSSGCRVRCG